MSASLFGILPGLGAQEMLLLLVLGIYPKPALDVINPAVDHTLRTIHQQDPVPTAEGASR